MGEAVGNDAVGRSEGAGFGTFGKDYPLRMLPWPSVKACRKVA